jgi:serine/threonine protein phosphatase PrpC
MIIKTLTEAEAKGSRSYMEDTHFVSTRPEGTLLAVFDGHGGHEASERAFEQFASLFLVQMGKDVGDVSRALRASIFYLAETLRDYKDGTTLSAVYVPKEGNIVTAAVIGDSPILIGGSTSLWVGPDHNVRSNPAEADAVQERGGFIANGYAMEHYSGSGLQMGRALGDMGLSSILSTEPEIKEVLITNETFILVATDGLFDPGHRNHDAIGDVVKLLRSGSHGEFTAEDLVRNALYRKTGDNVTAILARL